MRVKNRDLPTALGSQENSQVAPAISAA